MEANVIDLQLALEPLLLKCDTPGCTSCAAPKDGALWTIRRTSMRNGVIELVVICPSCKQKAKKPRGNTRAG